MEVAAERFGPVLEPDQAGAVAEVRAAAAVVADAHVQDAVAFGHLDVGGGGAGVLGGVGQCFGDGVVGGGLDRLGQPPVDLDVEVGPGRRSGGPASSGPGAGRRRPGWPGAGRGRSRAVPPVRRPARRPLRSSCCASSPAPGGAVAWAARRSRARETRRCWAPSCRLRSMRRRVASAVATIRAREAVRAAWASALAIAVAASSVNPASRASVPAGSGPARDPTIMTPHSRPSTLTGTPTPARRPNSRASLGDRARGAGVVVDPRRPAGLEHQRVQVPPAEAPPGADGEGSAGAVPRGDHRYRAVGAVPAHRRVVGAQQPPGFLGDRGEHLRRRRRAGHQRRHPPQRGLLLGEPAQFHAGLGVGDRGGGQLGEPGQPRLGAGRQRLRAGSHDHDAPQPRPRR